MRLKTSTSGEILSHFRTESNLLNAIGSTLRIDIYVRNVISPISIARDPRRYLLGTTRSRRTNLSGRSSRLSSLDAALASKAL
jgi:hypothetical protein